MDFKIQDDLLYLSAFGVHQNSQVGAETNVSEIGNSTMSDELIPVVLKQKDFEYQDCLSFLKILPPWSFRGNS